MRVGNISNVCFGKTVRVNMPTEAAFHLANILNSKEINPADIQIKEDAIAIFDDINQGKAVFCSPDDGKTSYILTGEEASTLLGIRKKALNALEAVSVFYEEGPFADKNIEYICKKEKRDVSNLIRSTKEKFAITVYNDEKTESLRLSKLKIIG